MPSYAAINLDVAEALSGLNSSELNSSVMPRWQRKALAASQQNTSSISATPGRKAGERSFSNDSPSVSDPDCLKLVYICFHLHVIMFLCSSIIFSCFDATKTTISRSAGWKGGIRFRWRQKTFLGA